jgi:phosphoribosylanthranilate isomerase
MSLVTKVKAANITNLSDARYCAGMGVEWIGFPSQDVSPAMFAEITGWLSGPQWVIELNEQPWPEPTAYPVKLWECIVNDLELALVYPGKVIVGVFAFQWRMGDIVPRLLEHRDRIEFIILSVSAQDLDVDLPIVKAMQELFPLVIDIRHTPHPVDEILTWPIKGLNVYGSLDVPEFKFYPNLAEVLEPLERD